MPVVSLPADKPKIVFHAAMMAIQNFGFFTMYWVSPKNSGPSIVIGSQALTLSWIQIEYQDLLAKPRALHCQINCAGHLWFYAA